PLHRSLIRPRNNSSIRIGGVIRAGTASRPGSGRVDGSRTRGRDRSTERTEHTPAACYIGTLLFTLELFPHRDPSSHTPNPVTHTRILNARSIDLNADNSPHFMSRTPPPKEHRRNGDEYVDNPPTGRKGELLEEHGDGLIDGS
uniref:hypothetical protein n=1 Tax=Brachybacterium alimentarium TaxID=47845 RepID=UPI001C69DA43